MEKVNETLTKENHSHGASTKETPLPEANKEVPSEEGGGMRNNLYITPWRRRKKTTNNQSVIHMMEVNDTPRAEKLHNI